MSWMRKCFFGGLLSGVVVTTMMMPHAFGLTLDERLSLNGIPVAQWIVLFDGTSSQMLPASLRADDGSFVLSAEIGEVPTSTLVSAVVQLADGAVTSTALHTPGAGHLSGESRELAERRRAELLKELSILRTDITRLETDMESAESALRVKAGLVDVDKVYERRAEILRQIAERREAVKAEP